MAWLPIFFLFFSAHLSIDQVLILESIYYLSVVVLEVPSGYFSDSIGRKTTLLISSLGFCLAYILFAFGSTFVVLTAAQFLLACGMAFRSGTSTVFHYESLKALGKAEEYGDREAQVYKRSFLFSGIAILAGGALGIFNLRFGYVLSLITAAAGLFFVFRFQNPTSNEKSFTLLKQLKACLSYLKNRQLRWLFVYGLCLFILMHVPYEFYQPYLKILETKTVSIPLNAALLSGIIYALTRVIASWFAGKSVRFAERFGLIAMLSTAFIWEVLVIGIMGSVLHYGIIAIILMRSVPMALTKAPINATVTPQIQAGQRATYLSIQSLTNRMGFAFTLLLISLGIAGDQAADWPTLKYALRISAGLGLLFIAILVIGFPGRRFFDDRQG